MAKVDLIISIKFTWWFQYLYMPMWNFIAQIYNEFLPMNEQPEISENFKWWFKKGTKITTATN